MRTGVDWPVLPLEKVTTVITKGTTPTTLGFPFVEAGVRFVKAESLTPQGSLLADKCAYIDLAADEALRRSRLQVDDVLYTIAGVIGRTGYVQSDWLPANTNQAVAILRPETSRIDPRFLFYAVSSPSFIKDSHGRVVQTAQANLSLGMLRASPIALPPLFVQRRIASILGAYDDLIEVNRRRIAVLEEMARRLFEEWFVVPYGESLASDAEVSAGREATVGEVIRFVRGRSYRSADLAESGGLPFVNLKCILRDGGFRRDGVKRYIGEYKPEQVLRAGDIVLAVTDMTQDRRIVGQAALIPKSEEPTAVMSMDLVKAVPSANLDPLFCYYWLRFSGFASQAAQHANGANVLHLSPAAMAGLPIRIPPLARQEHFSRVVQPMTEHAQVLALAIDKLAASRDLLLPRLVSGDLSVAAAGRELEAVA